MNEDGLPTITFECKPVEKSECVDNLGTMRVRDSKFKISKQGYKPEEEEEGEL